MVSEMIDYVAAAVGIVIVFLGGIFIFGNMLTNGINYSEQKNAILNSQSLFDYILLSPGSPYNWGSTSKQPMAFGLGDPQSTQPYALSQASVMRLLESSSAFQTATVSYYGKTYINLTQYNFSVLLPSNSVLNYTFIKQLLGINGQYEFLLTIQPAINFTIHRVQSNRGTDFSVYLTSYQGLPLAGAQVNGSLIYLSQLSSKPSKIYFSAASATTNISGTATLQFNTQASANSFALIVQATAAGLVGWGYYSSLTPSRLEAYALIMPGLNQLTLVQHCAFYTTPSCGKDYFNVSELVPSGSNSFAVSNLTCTSYKLIPGKGGGNENQNSTCTATSVDGYIVVSIAQVGNGQQSNTILEIFPLNPALGDLNVEFGLNPVTTQAVTVTTLTRLVSIGGVSYVATFAYWPDHGQVYGGFP